MNKRKRELEKDLYDLRELLRSSPNLSLIDDRFAKRWEIEDWRSLRVEEILPRVLKAIMMVKANLYDLEHYIE